jgi:hypothetical protein
VYASDAAIVRRATSGLKPRDQRNGAVRFVDVDVTVGDRRRRAGSAPTRTFRLFTDSSIHLAAEMVAEEVVGAERISAFRSGFLPWVKERGSEHVRFRAGVMKHDFGDAIFERRDGWRYAPLAP